MTIPKPVTYSVVAILAAGLLYAGFAGYEAWQEHKAHEQSQQAQQHHEAGINQASQGTDAATEGDLAIQRAKALQGKLAVADAEVARLKAILAHQTTPPEHPVAGPGSMPVIPNTPTSEGDVKDKLIESQDKEIGLLKLQVVEYKSASEHYKDYGDHYKAAYSEECKAHNLDNIAHQASLAAQKSKTIKVGIFSFGGGALVGWMAHR